jgi:hypothetical protein
VSIICRVRYRRCDLEVMRCLDRLHLQFPFAGSRILRGPLAAEGCKIGRRHVKTLMKRMGIEALYRRPRTTKPELDFGQFRQRAGERILQGKLIRREFCYCPGLAEN